MSMGMKLTKALKRVQLSQNNNMMNSSMSTYTVILSSTTYSEMTVKAHSLKEARENAAIQLASMGWVEWIVGHAWRGARTHGRY